VDLDDGRSVQVQGVVCGDALRARYKEPPPEKVECAVELRFKNDGNNASLSSFAFRLLRRTADGAAVEEGRAVVWDREPDRNGSGFVNHGDDAVVLLTGTTPLALGKGFADERLLVRVYGRTTTWNLRTDVTR
jgi:hypothetical protein